MDHPRFLTKERALLAIGLAAAAGAVLPMLGNALVWDDPFIIGGLVKLDSSEGFWAIVTQSFWRTSTYLAYVGKSTLWRPLTSCVLWIGGLIFGYWAPGFHLISILALAGCGVAFYRLLTRLSPPTEERAPMAWIALLFVCHPLAVEVACLVSNVSDHLSFVLLCGQLIVYCDLLAERRPAKTALPLAAVLGFGACATKELGVTSIVMPLAAYLFCLAAGNASVSKRSLLSGKLWVSAALPVVLFLVLRSFVVDASTALPDRPPETLSLLAFAWGHLMVRAAVPFPVGTHVAAAVNDPQTIAGLATGAGLLVFAAYFSARVRGKITPLLLGTLTALVLLAPSLLAVAPHPGEIAIPTRYFHLPLVGLLIAAAPAAHSLWPHRLFKVALPCAVILLALLSFVRVREWSDRVTLWSAEIHYNPDAIFPRLNLAAAMVDRQAFTQAEEVLEDAERRPEIRPFFTAQIYGIRAEIVRKRDGDLDRATTLLEEALRLSPKSLDLVDDLALTRAQAGRLDQAVEILKKALGSGQFTEAQRYQIKRRIEHYKRHIEKEKSESRSPGGNARKTFRAVQLPY